MIDLETLDTGRTAVVLSIGMMLFDRNGRELGSETIHPCYDEQVKAGRTVSFSTLRFWTEQSGAALTSTFVDIPRQASLKQVRERFQRMAWKKFTSIKLGSGEEHVEEVTAVWANGDLFDLGICTDLLGDMPWKYNAPRDLRTLAREAQSLGWAYPEPRDGHAAHSAIDDCRYQVDCLVSIRRFLAGNVGSDILRMPKL